GATLIGDGDQVVSPSVTTTYYARASSNTVGVTCINTACATVTVTVITSCDDSDPCTVDSCSNGVCTNNSDDDNDGIDNCVDQCPNTPVGEPVKAGGCSCSQLADPTCNDNDACTVDSCTAGVCNHSFQDADGDGVCDANDQCPGTPGGEPVNASGCG